MRLAILALAFIALAGDAAPSAANATYSTATLAAERPAAVTSAVVDAPLAAPRLATWPVIGGTITSPFGARVGGFHNGIDIAAPMYTPIHAAQAGVVQLVGQPYMSYGDTADIVMIAHASNFSTLYAHVDLATHPPVVKAGQRVAAGDVIAYVGVTGWTTGPHVHFMTIYNQRQVDPLRFLP